MSENENKNKLVSVVIIGIFFTYSFIRMASTYKIQYIIFLAIILLIFVIPIFYMTWYKKIFWVKAFFIFTGIFLSISALIFVIVGGANILLHVDLMKYIQRFAYWLNP